jgi:hypothetical protein
MTRNSLILLQVVGALSILPYPFVLVANIMSIAAPGHTPATQLPWILMSFYPLVWIVLYVIAWRAMARGAVGLAFGLSSIPVLAEVLVVGIIMFSSLVVGLGTAGIGPGGLHSKTYSTGNPLVTSIQLACQDVDLPPGHAANTEKALRDIEANPAQVNASHYPRGSPLNVALGCLIVNIDGTIASGRERQQERIRIIRALVAHGAQLDADESADLRQTWNLRRALHDGPVTTATENPLVWRIVTHNRGEQKPWDPLHDPLPARRDGPEPFVLRPGELALLNRSTILHGTPLYAALLDNAAGVCAVLIRSGGHLSFEEERDRAASAALERVFEGDAGVRAVYTKAF